MSAGDDDLPLTLKGLHRTPGGHVTVEVGMECFDMARELEQARAERDAAQARVRALVAALRMVEGEFDHLDGEGFEDQPNAECPLCVIRAALTAPDAALVARERARDAVVEGTAAFLRARAAYVRSVTPGRIGGYGALLDAQQKALAELERRVAALDALAAPERGDG